jgi:hypothetical protein
LTVLFPDAEALTVLEVDVGVAFVTGELLVTGVDVLIGQIVVDKITVSVVSLAGQLVIVAAQDVTV